MSKKDQVLIRSTEYLKDRNLLDIFLETTRPIPIYYQYGQKSSAVQLPDTNIIGYASNIRESMNTVVCSVEIMDYKSLSSNFMGLIDNYTLKTLRGKDDKHDYEIVRFIVYDKELKRKVDEKIYGESYRKTKRAK